jgi:ATP-binding cassette subfamily F protein uup
VEGRYSDFLAGKQEFLAAQSRQQDALANRVRRELEWLRRGPKARTGKSRARIGSAERMIGELAAVTARNTTAAAQIDFTASERRTRRLLAAEGVGKEMGGRRLFSDLSFTLSPGVKLGLAGPNGSGKTTLLRILAGELEPDDGCVERADALQVVYFDQRREQLAPAASLREALSPSGGDTVIYRGRPVHVAGWAKRFLFRPEQLEMPVGRLSGGEQARVLVARLMLAPADLLLLDEPTNNLDIPTLEVLEESLLEFPGALVLVTHDRFLLDRVSTVVLGLDGEGSATVFADYSQWEQAREASRRARLSREAPQRAPTPAARAKKRLSYLESREWEQMEERIVAAEEAVRAGETALHAPEAVSDPIEMQKRYENLKRAQEQVDELYARWAELENKLR